MKGIKFFRFFVNEITKDFKTSLTKFLKILDPNTKFTI